MLTDAQRIAYAINRLYETYTKEGVGVWLVGRHRSVGGLTPLGLLGANRVDEFVAHVEKLEPDQPKEDQLGLTG